MANIRAIGLFSGGLDSILAFKLLQEQSIEVIGLYCVTPFFNGYKQVVEIAKTYKIPLVVEDVLEDYLKLIKNPKYGYGKNFNPCIDCHAFMIKKAWDMRDRFHANFVFTGEVLGERPFSQTYYGLKKVEMLAGLVGYVLRPLSAKLLPISYAEKQGWVDRDMLCAIKGRSRRPQFELARKYGIEIKPKLQPAGGCLLTDPCISKRVKSYLRHFKSAYSVIWGLIKIGRHFLLNKDIALIVGRNEKENEIIQRYKTQDVILLRPLNVVGPLGLLFGSKLKEEERNINMAAEILASYCNKRTHNIEISAGAKTIIVSDRPTRKSFKRFAI